MESLLLPIGLAYFLISGVLFIFGVNFYYLTFISWRENRKKPDAGIEEQWTADFDWPAVTVQLPIYNEMYVAERVIRAAAELEYPAHLLQIQVLDDSTDETLSITRRVADQLQRDGVNIEHLHRTDRSGYKAGALQAGLSSATGDYIAIFDADFVPPSNFLQRALPYLDDPKAAFIQTRWGHLNRNYSWLTYLQSLAIDAHFMVEQFARSRLNYWFNFNGTAGIWRRSAIEDAGGWTADTLTEDLDLSYRAYLRGWHGRFARDIVVPAELPVSFSAFRRQQHRWAKGSLECAVKLAPQVWGARIPLAHKIQATLHLTGYSVHLLLLALTLIYPFVAVLAATDVRLSTLYGFSYLFAMTSAAPTMLFVAGQQQLGRPLLRIMPKILAVSVMGSGLMMNTAQAAWQILRKRENVFQRTAKFGIRQENQRWENQQYQLRLNPIVYPEIALGVYGLFSSWLAWQTGSWGILIFAFMFGLGLILVASVTISQGVRIYLSRRKGYSRTLMKSEGFTNPNPRHIES